MSEIHTQGDPEQSEVAPLPLPFARKKIEAVLQIPQQGGMNQVAGVGVDDEDFHVRFSIRELIAIAQRYPATDVLVSSLMPLLEGRQEDPSHTQARAQSAELQYPIIVFANDEGHIFAIGDGTHRVQKAHGMGLSTIKAHVIPKSEMRKFAVIPEHIEAN